LKFSSEKGKVAWVNEERETNGFFKKNGGPPKGEILAHDPRATKRKVSLTGEAMERKVFTRVTRPGNSAEFGEKKQGRKGQLWLQKQEGKERQVRASAAWAKKNFIDSGKKRRSDRGAPESRVG